MKRKAYNTDTSKTMVSFKEHERFLKSLIEIISSSIKYWFLYPDYEHFGIQTFRIYSKFL